MMDGKDGAGMTIAARKLTFEEYLSYDDGTDTRYELVNGELVAMSLGTGRHGKIIKFVDDQLNRAIQQSGLDWTSQRLTVGVQSPRGYRWDTCRIPDITVLTLEQWSDMDDREAVILAHQAPPKLVVEVVSPSTQTEDYRAKWVEYSALDIAEYWMIDPIQNIVTICILEQGRYQDTIFRGKERIISPTFPRLNLTAEQILKAEG
ncbi:Uma2 family endonuclease [Kovacikia minuta CCNUW1]|uniref:Uma2 family endonuclease n=1 Tax=Kovacikia minuta TaxID=2931930 RepID=UPI001CD024BB|nr:Uma2 family endonuclease [Kovacikia minuta]UBF28893.1 Uma2 family endonuclease [Kovacikia minuta CCNUW1]